MHEPGRAEAGVSFWRIFGIVYGMNEYFDRMRESETAIPAWFYPFLEDRPFERCLICERELLTGDVHYLIEKAWKGTEVIFEYAICIACTECQQEELSLESLQNISKYFMAQPHFMRRPREVMNWPAEEPVRWTQCCALTNRPREEIENYQIFGHFRGNKMILSVYPLLICDEATEALAERLSKKTRDSLDDFVGEFLGMPPEFEIAPEDRPLVLF